MKARYIARNGLNTQEIEAESVAVVAPDGTEVELCYRRSDGEIALSVNGVMVITPTAANTVRIGRARD